MPIKTIDARGEMRVLCDESSPFLGVVSADLLAPTIGVDDRAGEIEVLEAGELMRSGDLRRHSDGSFTRATYKTTGDMYTTRENGLEVPVNNVEKMSSLSRFNKETVAFKMANNAVTLGREKNVSGALSLPANYLADNIDVVGIKWNLLNATPAVDIDAMAAELFASCGLEKEQLTFAIPRQAIEAVMKCTEIKDNNLYTAGFSTYNFGMKTEYLRNYFGVSRIIPTGGTYNSAGENLPAEFTRIWNKGVIVGGYMPISPANDWSEPALARQPVWTAYAQDRRFESYQEEELDATICRVREYRGVHMNKKFGALRTGAL